MDEPQKEGAPAWMVSFGDMMTLILTFFILMVSLSHEQQPGLMAKGVGSFIIAVRSFGLDGVMDEYEENAIFENVRVRFNLPPEADDDRRTDFIEATDLELVRAVAAEALRPHDELNQPTIATFEHGTAELSEAARVYLDIVASTLRPGKSQTLVLEGHAVDGDPDAGAEAPRGDRRLAFERARNVMDYLVEELGFPAERVEARAWLAEIDGPGVGTRGVDARLITPTRSPRTSNRDG
jgi:chemotaxis protein MotB